MSITFSFIGRHFNSTKSFPNILILPPSSGAKPATLAPTLDRHRTDFLQRNFVITFEKFGFSW